MPRRAHEVLDVVYRRERIRGRCVLQPELRADNVAGRAPTAERARRWEPADRTEAPATAASKMQNVAAETTDGERVAVFK